MNPPAIQKLGSAVLLEGPAVADAAYLISVGLRALQRRGGVAPMSRWLVLQRQLRAVADLPIPEMRNFLKITMRHR
jgi:hypothetical protein